MSSQEHDAFIRAGFWVFDPYKHDEKRTLALYDRWRNRQCSEVEVSDKPSAESDRDFVASLSALLLVLSDFDEPKKNPVSIMCYTHNLRQAKLLIHKTSERVKQLLEVTTFDRAKITQHNKNECLCLTTNDGSSNMFVCYPARPETSIGTVANDAKCHVFILGAEAMLSSDFESVFKPAAHLNPFVFRNSTKTYKTLDAADASPMKKIKRRLEEDNFVQPNAKKKN